MLVGGIGTLMGPLLGTLIIMWLTQFLQSLEEYRMIVFGPLLVLLVIFFPMGIIGSFLSWRGRRAARRSPAHKTLSRVTEDDQDDKNREAGNNA